MEYEKIDLENLALSSAEVKPGARWTFYIFCVAGVMIMVVFGLSAVGSAIGQKPEQMIVSLCAFTFILGGFIYELRSFWFNVIVKIECVEEGFFARTFSKNIFVDFNKFHIKTHTGRIIKLIVEMPGEFGHTILLLRLSSFPDDAQSVILGIIAKGTKSL
ncbi:MAG: hypothetical protein NUW37_12535 [Planctomycetes bacterium]|nr:hypothetical protein [Planctomycetota bacterium]